MRDKMRTCLDSFNVRAVTFAIFSVCCLAVHRDISHGGGVRVTHPREDLGIVDVHIPGFHCVEVVLHVYLKAALKEDKAEIQGVAALEGVRDILVHGGPQMAESSTCRNEEQELIITLHSQNRAVIGNFTVLEADIHPAVRPKLIILTLNKTDFDTAFWISFNNGPRLAAIGDSLQSHTKTTVENERKEAAIVLTPPFKLKPETVSTLLQFHLEYHQQAGFSKQVLYSRTSRVLEPIPDVIEAIQTGYLTIVSWTASDSGIALPAGRQHNGHPLNYYDQSVIYNHALLSFWGTNTLVFFLDLDEFFYVPRASGNIRALINGEGCLRQYRHQAKVQRFFTVCSDCENQAEWKTWVSSNKHNFLNHYSTLWRQESEFADVWDFKSLVDPDVTRHFHVHWGSPVRHLLPYGVEKFEEGVPEHECAIVIHFMNLLVSRLDMNATERVDIEIFKKALTEENPEGFIKLPFVNPWFEDF